MWSESYGWRWEVFSNYLSRNDLLKIAAYYLSPEPYLEDSLYWNASSSGKFTIKSTLTLIKTADMSPETEPIAWHVIWKLPVQQRVRMFIWLAAHGRLMTNYNRVRRGIHDDPICPRCFEEDESTDHHLRRCPYSRELWDLLGECVVSPSFFTLPFKTWISKNASDGIPLASHDWSMKFAITCWWIWRWRNNVTFGRSDDNPLEPIRFLRQQFEITRKALGPFSIFIPIPGTVHEERFIRWNTPPHGWVFLNTDGASKGNPGPAGCGGILRDETGDFLSAYNFLGGICTSMRAEMHALVVGLKQARALGIRKLLVHMDNKTCVPEMSNTRGSIQKGKGPLEEEEEGDKTAFLWDEETVEGEIREQFMLVGKLWASRAINIKAAVDTMARLWNLSKAICGNVIDAKEKTFVFKFDGERDKQRVLEGQPWHFEKFVWCFNEPNREGKLSDVPLVHFPIWARVYDLPITGRSSQSNIQRIGECLGTFVEADNGQDSVLDRAVRIRIIHDVRQPLKATVPIKMKNGRVINFDVKYERLPIFCYGCGVMGHGEKDCDNGPYEEGELRFGEWLRASPWKVTKTKTEGSGKARRDLNASFDEVQKRDEELDIAHMIERLKTIAIDLKLKKSMVQQQSHQEEATVILPSGGSEERGEVLVNANREVESLGNGGLTIGSELVKQVGGLNEGGIEVREMGESFSQIMEGMGEEAGDGIGTTDVMSSGQKGSTGGKKREWKKFAREGRVMTYTEEARVIIGKRDREEEVRREAPAMMFLCETKLCGREMRRVREKFEGYDGLDVDSMGRSGGLAFMWKREIDCQFVSASVHHMDFHVRESDKEWRVTGFYGWPSVSDRHLSWDLLRLLHRQSALPWICVGDFNEILFSTEMKGGSRAQWQMNNFQAAVDYCGLKDVAWEGYQFTFDNGQVGAANRQSMIDRAMCSESWLELFPYAKLYHLEREWSDHAPIKLTFDRREIGGKTRSRFRFEQIWVGEPGCEEAIERGMARGHGSLMEGLKECARELHAWKKINIGKIRRSLETKRRQLARLNGETRSEVNVQRRRKLVAEIADLYRQEEQYWRQRSRALRLKDGDRNAKFFHSKAGERKRKNYIGALIDDSGAVRAGYDEVSNVANSYFQDLFTSSMPAQFDDILVGLEGRVTDQMNSLLKAEFREEEIVEALNQMHPLKAPGPDGMNGLFYQTYWHVVGQRVVATVLGILRGELSPEQINKTFIVLIPKKKAPDKIRDFRPISLCNVVYKLVSKVLANRLKLFLGDIISENQSAFTPGRLISDNILIAFEVFHHMKNNRNSEGYMAIKLDMAKAYDRVEWSFLHGVMRTMGFAGTWIRRVMDCVSSVTFSVLINGEPSREFRPSRGLRQGDPLSPYLFLLCAEALSNLMRRAVENNSIHGIRVAPTAPVISHLLFADDSIFFARATVEEAEAINGILRQYEMASGQLVSLDKTTVSFSRGVSEDRRGSVAERLGVSVVEEQAKYLGLPTVIGRSKKVITDIIRDKLCKRLQGWRGKILSRAGKEVLIKAVANSLPTYVMSVFKIPANFCDELRSIVSRFWWGHDDNKKGIFWVAWNKLVKPKAEGGIGFRDFRLFNLALLGKQAWRLITNSGSLWSRLAKARYYPQGEFMTASLGHNPSYTWRSIYEARTVMEQGLRRRIGDGMETLIWGHAWVLNTQTGRIISPCLPGNEGLHVSDLLRDDGREWDAEKAAQLLLPFEVDRVKNLRISPNRQRDIWFWGRERDGMYTVRSAYKMLAGEVGDMASSSDWERSRWLWNRMWKVSVWPRVKLFFWQMCSEALATRANIAARIGGEFSMCPFCSSCIESSLHLFMGCGVAKWVWEELGISGGRDNEGGDIRTWVEQVWSELSSTECSTFMVGCWAIWEHRNKVIFEEARIDPEGVVRRVRDVLEEGGGLDSNTPGRRRGRGRSEGGDANNGEGWMGAKDGYVKLNVDAGVKEGEGVGTRAVCRDGRGDVMWGLTVIRDESWEVDEAEAIAVLDGLEEAARNGVTKVEVESDSLLVVEALRARKQGRSVFFNIIEDIFVLVSNFQSVRWSHTSRLNNCVAHALAHLAPRVVGRHVWSNVLPISANAAVLFDKSLIK
ncbi:uncharacterized protein LOC141641217 [Silene latifolia]|uniref:uncharacterized protein LOC141641217 n=1 Tax=Silene latifolia TaxID=37657 RepID=UPI003D77DC48